ncbi:MAG: 2'-5' RNA ligase family protein [Halobacteriaceae archaeon]
MYSVNTPLPPAVEALVAELQPALAGYDRREDPTLLVKRLDPEGRTAAGIDPFPRLVERVRSALDGAPACEAKVTGVDAFADPPAGPAPVVYLVVESPGLHALHERLVDAFSAVHGIEGSGYTPHVTLGRGGDPAVARDLAARDLEPVTWTVDEMVLYDARHGEPVRRFPLPFTA